MVSIAAAAAAADENDDENEDSDEDDSDHDNDGGDDNDDNDDLVQVLPFHRISLYVLCSLFLSRSRHFSILLRLI